MASLDHRILVRFASQRARDLAKRPQVVRGGGGVVWRERDSAAPEAMPVGGRAQARAVREQPAGLSTNGM